MKKNMMMRIASVLLIAVLISTCGISGTYAKYVTSASGSDSARVAKWGVTVVVAGNELFANQYEDTTNGITVDSIDDQKVVAPGTSSDESTAMTFSITGQPEVDVALKFVLENVKDVCLKAGTYTDYTEVTGYDSSNNPIYGKTFTLDDDYYPVVFTLKNNNGTELAKGRMEDIKHYLEDPTNPFTKNYDAETNLATIAGGTNGVYTLSWAWDFDGEQTLNGKVFTEKQVDQADTLLGNLMVNPSLVDAVKYNLTVGYKMTITATQID